jgi:hypothetical protein
MEVHFLSAKSVTGVGGHQSVRNRKNGSGDYAASCHTKDQNNSIVCTYYDRQRCSCQVVSDFLCFLEDCEPILVCMRPDNLQKRKKEIDSVKVHLECHRIIIDESTVKSLQTNESDLARAFVSIAALKISLLYYMSYKIFYILYFIAIAKEARALC